LLSEPPLLREELSRSRLDATVRKSSSPEVHCEKNAPCALL
jgi:hypothetical protein